MATDRIFWFPIPVLMTFACFVGLPLSEVAKADEFRPRDTQAPGESPPTAEEAAALISVPEGFQVRLFAGDPAVRQPVAMALDDRARLFVGESYSYKEWEMKGEDRILILEDRDNDGHHDSRKVFVDGINHLSGMTVGWGGVWVCSAPNLLFYPDRNRDDIPDGEPEIVLDGWTTEAGHNFFNGLTWGIDGWLYGRHGITKPSKVGKPGTPDEERIEFDCSIWRYHPVSKKFEVVCRGTTNPWGLDWNERGDLFFTNNVNGHLWHAIPGAYYPRMGERNDPFSKFVYDRIGMCCDHLHHAGSHRDWTKTRDGKGVHGELGGGHSHCGGMIYQGGKWPRKYHDKMFMCNTHGRRVNVDRLEQKGSTYVGKHEPDFLQANNPWFRGVELIYGPDGDVFLSDWVDNGECHDNDGVHRSSGRIYKIIFGEPSPPMSENLWQMSRDELFALHDHKNEWYARKARWVLLEKLAIGEFSLDEWKWDPPVPDGLLNEPRLRRQINRTNLALTHELLSKTHPNANRNSNLNVLKNGTVEAQKKPSSTDAVIARKFASGLSQNSSENPWQTVEMIFNLSTTPDETIDLLTYYGIKDIAAHHPKKSQNALLLASFNHPQFTKNLSQNLAENQRFEALLSILDRTKDTAMAGSILDGFALGIKGQKNLQTPKLWPNVFARYFSFPELQSPSLAIHLVFDETDARTRIEEMLKNDSASAALELLADHPITGLHESLLPLLTKPKYAKQVIPLLANSNSTEIAAILIEQYAQFDADAKMQTINALCSRKEFAKVLLEALENKKVPTHAVTAFHARQLRLLKDPGLTKRLTKAWGRIASTNADKKAEIKKWQDQLLPDVLANADLANGHSQFQNLCQVCHKLNGVGGNLGPNLSGANRNDLYYLLENIIDPSATLPADYQMNVITKNDGVVVAGNMKSENEYSFTIITQSEEVIVAKEAIEKRETLERSIMPEGMLDHLSPDDVRDLIAWLQK